MGDPREPKVEDVDPMPDGGEGLLEELISSNATDDDPPPDTSED